MKIRSIQGCTSDVFEIDGIGINHCDNDTILRALGIVLEGLKKEAYKEPTWYLNDLLESYIEPSYHMWDNEPCEQCGDNVCITEWEL